VTTDVAEKPATTPVFFESPAAFRAWLQRNHETASELNVGFYKRHTKKPSMTWPESVDQALAYGWIDGIRRSLGEDAYTIRFSPRRKGSIWSAVNIKRVGELKKQNLMTEAGLVAFALRKENRSGVYAYEQRTPELPEEFAKVFRKNKEAWKHFEAQAPWYRKTTMWYVVSAKRDETRRKRLNTLIDCSARGKLLPGLDRTKKKTP
jgi:uncharacterized protein YdeI (YjbR/CyaY-like superfamily)